jgi:hypothetical protein
MSIRFLGLAVRYIFLALLIFYSNSSSSESFPNLFPDDRSLQNPLLYIFIGTIESIHKGESSMQNGETFMGTINVNEVLRGHKLKTGPVTAKWSSTGEQRKFSRLEPMQVPRELKTKEKVLAFSWLNNDGTAIIYRFFEGSKKNRSIAVGYMATPEWSSDVRRFLFFLMIGFPSIALLLHFNSNTYWFKSKHQKKIKIYIFGAPILTLVSYLVYESGISHYSNIRADLLIILPIVIGSFLLWLFPLFQIYKRRMEGK